MSEDVIEIADIKAELDATTEALNVATDKLKDFEAQIAEKDATIKELKNRLYDSMFTRAEPVTETKDAKTLYLETLKKMKK